MKKSFEDLAISAPILKALKTMGFETPTEVQTRAIPHVLEREDLIVKSKTGTGKTAVFGVPMLQMIDPLTKNPQGLILTPTRELAVQVDNDLKQMSRYLRHKTTAVYGQHNINAEKESLDSGASIVTGTPGRVFDHIRQGNLKTKDISFLVLDEADRMLDMGFLDQVIRIIKTLPRDRVTLLFSATIPPEVQKICRNFMKRPATIEIESPTSTVDTIQQSYYRVNNNEKNTQLNRILLLKRPESCLIFCNTKIKVDKVQAFLGRKGYASRALHGDIPQSKRMKTINSFKRGDFSILVATDVAARGIHVDDLSLVINYDVPLEKDGYVHRIGRTGRAGNGGCAVSLVTSDDIMSLYEIEEHIGAMIPEEELPTDAELSDIRSEAEKWKSTQLHMSETPRVSTSTNRKADSPLDNPRRRKRTPQRNQNSNVRKDSAPASNRVERNNARPNDRHINTEPAVHYHGDVKPQPVKPVHTPAKAAPPQVETPQNKPFLKRVLNRILGR